MGISSDLLTVRGIAAMKPGESAADPAARGAGRLEVRKLASGEITWYYRYTAPGGDRVRLPLGASLSLADARKAAAELSKRYQSGERDLRGVLEDEQRRAEQARCAAEKAAVAQQERAGATLGLLLAAYVEHLKAAGKPSWREVETSVERNITKPYPKIAALPADEVTVDEVMPLFHRLAKAGKLRAAEKLRAHLRAAYTAARRARNDATMHAFSRFKVASNPLVDLEVTRPKEAVERAIYAAKERKWALSEEQLRHYWRRICALPEPDSALLRFHLLTGGQRVEQLGRLTKHDYDPDRQTVTLLDTKGRRKVAYEHVVPLIPDAVKAMESMRGDLGNYLFTITQGAQQAGYHNVWERVQDVALAMVAAGEIDREFSPGTIRKTVETRLQAAGGSREMRGHLLSHGLGGVQARHYEAHEYDEEKRKALMGLRESLEPQRKVALGATRSSRKSGTFPRSG